MPSNPTFYDIYEYYEPAWWTQKWALSLFASLGILLILLIVLLIIKKKKKKILPWDWAIAQINKLTTSTLSTQKDFKTFYFALTNILKHYFHLRYFWQTADKTDQELITLLQEQQFDEQHLELVKKILSSALWIKFANEGALKNQIEQDKLHILDIIEKTKPSDYKKVS